MFEIGDKVVCVDDSPNPAFGPIPITKGLIYVVRSICHEGGLRLLGIKLPWNNWCNCEKSFHEKRFRKLSDMQAEARDRRKERQPA